jgi:hypothetical protein
MSNLKVPEKAAVLESVSVAVVPSEPKPARVFHDKIPCNWSIVLVDDGIEATNSSSGEFFKGSIQEFNNLLRN